MYVPAHFAPPDSDAVDTLLRHRGAADLITATPDGLQATLLPFLYEPGPVGGPGVLRGHLARNNPQWQSPARGEVLVIVRGPDAYVSPAWYPSTTEHGRSVPTWNYVTAHVHGRLVVHDDVAWVDGLVRDLTHRYEDDRPQPWRVEQAPAAYYDGQLRGIVGVEVVISRIEAKFKLNQNRSAADVDGVIGALDTESPGTADAMRQARDAGALG